MAYAEAYVKTTSFNGFAYVFGFTGGIMNNISRVHKAIANRRAIDEIAGQGMQVQCRKKIN